MRFDESLKERGKASWKGKGKWKGTFVMHECGQLLIVFEACALMIIERKEERQVRENGIAQVWT